MKKITYILVVVWLFFALCVTGCSPSEGEGGGYTFTDDLGRVVSVRECERVATLLGSFADMWMLAGGSVVATADDAFEDLNLNLAPDVINLGSTHNPSREGVFLCSPQLVLASAKLSKHLEMREALELAGITVAYFDVANFNDFLRVFEVLTDLTGRADLYQKHGVVQQQTIDYLLQKHADEKGQTVLVLRASASSIRAKNSNGTMLGGMLRDFGCINVADSDSMILENLSLESIVLKNPDKIFFVEAGDDREAIRNAVYHTFNQNPLWQTLDAVKEGRVYFMEKELYNLKPNANFALAYQKLEKILYEK